LLFGYRSDKNYTEIVMTHGGNCLMEWMKQITEKDKLVNFAADFLR